MTKVEIIFDIFGQCPERVFIHIVIRFHKLIAQPIVTVLSPRVDFYILLCTGF